MRYIVALITLAMLALLNAYGPEPSIIPSSKRTLIGVIFCAAPAMWSIFEYFNFLSRSPDFIGANHPFKGVAQIVRELEPFRNLPVIPALMLVLTVIAYSATGLGIPDQTNVGTALLYLGLFSINLAVLFRSWQYTLPPPKGAV